MKTLHAFFLGRRTYGPTFSLMESLFEKRQRGLVGDLALFLEHDRVITTGRGAKPGNILMAPEFLRARGVEVYETRRGGDVTLHAPGQLIGYPIVDLRPDRADVRAYVQGLTRVMQQVCAPRGIASGTIPNMIGLWADRDHPADWGGLERATTPVKLGAIGVRISRWVTSHGFALNLSTDLDLFSLIVPCGISEYGVGSIELLRGSAPSVEEAAGEAGLALARELERTLQSVDLRSVTEDELEPLIEKLATPSD